MHTIVKNLFGASLVAALSACGGGEVSKYSDEEKNTSQEIIIDQFNGSEGETTPGSLSPEELAQLPVVTASSQQFADANVVVFLDGSAAVSASAGEDASITGTIWQQLAGPSVELLSAQRLSNLFIAPDVSEATQLVFQLAAQDSSGRINADTVSVIVQPVEEALIRVIGGVVNESDGVVQFTVKLLEASDEVITVRYTTKPDTATEGEDYEAANGELSFAAGELEKTITINLLADENSEDFETFSLLVTAIVGTSTSSNIASAVIRDTDFVPSPTPTVPPSLPSLPPSPSPTLPPTPTATLPPSPTPIPTPTPTADPSNIHSPEWDLRDANAQLRGSRINLTLESDGETYDLHTVNIDGDDDLDLLVATDTTVELLTNNGDGTFSESTILNDSSIFNRFVQTADLDQDGDIDIISRSSLFELVWLENNGEFTPREIATSYNNLNQLQPVDIDGDGDTDLSFILNTGEWTWLENTAGSGAEVSFVEKLSFGAERISATSFQPVDFDSDGDLDIVLGGISSTLLLTNDGEQNFVFSDLASRECYNLKALDFNGNTLIDLLCSDSNGRTLDLLENSVELGFTTTNITTLRTGRIEELQVYDWDNDGDTDIFVSANDGATDELNTVGFYENNSGSFSGSPDIPIEKFSELHEFGDFDGDGRTDIIFNWQEYNLSLVQQVQPNVFQIRELFTRINVVGDMQRIDFDYDGDQDIVGMSEVYYFAGEGIDSKYFYFMLENNAIEPAKLKILKVLYDIEARSHLAADIDQDRDIDLITGTNVLNAGFNWYENQSVDDTIRPSFTIGSYIVDQALFTEHAFIYEEPFTSIVTFTEGDVNADGSRDIVFGDSSGLAVLLFNDGSQDFSKYTTISSALYDELLAADLDNDGTLDLVSDRGLWYPGASDTANPLSIAEISNRGNQIKLEDIDSDGDLDYLLFDLSLTTLTVLENNGAASFNPLPDLELNVDEFQPRLFGSATDYWGISMLGFFVPDGPGDITVNWRSQVATSERVDRSPTLLPNLGFENYGSVQALSMSDLNGDAKEDVLMSFGNELAWYQLDVAADFRVEEGQTLVGTASASDADGDTLVYRISGGADAALFSVDVDSGSLSFNSPPLYSEPGDADVDNIYEVELAVSDGQNEITRTFLIQVIPILLE